MARLAARTALDSMRYRPVATDQLRFKLVALPAGGTLRVAGQSRRAAMYYPPKFPPEAQNKVEAAKIRAGREFDRNKRAAPSAREIQLSLIHYIMRVFGVFVQEAKMRRVWHASDMKSECLEFLRQLTIEAESEKGYDHAGRPLSPMTSHVDGSILREVRRAFSTWPAWRQFESALLAVATSPTWRVEAQPSPEREQPQKEPTPVSQAPHLGRHGK